MARRNPLRERNGESPQASGKWEGAGRAVILLLLGVVLAQRASAGGVARRVEDLLTTDGEIVGGVCSYVEPFAGLGAQAVFAGASSTSGCELFRVSAGGQVSLVREMTLGPLPSNVDFVGTMGGIAYFTANTPVTGTELWRTDGTTQGTFLLADASAGPSDPTDGYRPYFSMGSFALFGAWSREHGSELWRTDGTTAGTRLVKDIYPGEGGAFDLIYSPFEAVILDGVLYFGADDDLHGKELWRSDGTEEGTALVADLQPGSPSASSAPHALMVVGDQLVFAAYDGSGGSVMWRSDGTGAGTVPVGAFPEPSIGVDWFPASLGNRAVFLGRDAEHGLELWSTDGTASGTAMLRDIEPGAADSWFTQLDVIGPKAYFFAYDQAHGLEPWVSDGTGDGTLPLGDLMPGPGDSSPQWATPRRFFQELEGKVYFPADDGVHGSELWRSDGSAQGTALAVDLRPGAPASRPAPLGWIGERLALTAESAEGGRELFATDGNSGGTVQLSDLATSITASGPRHLTALVDKLLFAVEQADGGAGPWRSDGSEEGTFRIPAELGSRCCELELLTLPSGIALARSWNAGTGDLLWSTDGDSFESLGVFAHECGPHCVGGISGGLHRAADRAVFQWMSAGENRELWASDGTTGGTGLAVDIAPGPDSSSPSGFTLLAGRALFLANDQQHGFEPWISEGTSSTTELYADLEEGGDSGGWDLWPFDGEEGSFFFHRGIWGSGSEDLWFYDSSDGAVRQVAMGFEWGSSKPVGVVSGRMVFAASPAGDWESFDLWSSDGAESGTVLIEHFDLGSSEGVARNSAILDGSVYFLGCDFEAGCELWSSAGTVESTALVVEIEPGWQSSLPSRLEAIDGRLYFGACTSRHGCEPWISDGTPAGTHRAADIAPGQGSGLGVGRSYSILEVEFEKVGSTIYLPADDGTGTELWAMPIELFYDGFETGDVTRWSGVGEP